MSFSGALAPARFPIRLTPEAAAALAVLLLPVLFVAHLGLGATQFAPVAALGAILAPGDDAAGLLVLHLRLPRTVAALLAGAALGAAGALLQAATRNRLASPSLLGVSSGAHVGLAASILLVPGLSPLLALAPAFLGGLGAGALALGMAGGLSATPVRLILAGVIVSFAFSAVAVTLSLLYETDIAGLFLWGGGSLVQPDWAAPAASWLPILAALGAGWLMGPALDIAGLGDEQARALGTRPVLTRLGAAFLGCLLAASATLLAGPVSFVGLLAPNVMRLLGHRPQRMLILSSAAVGAVLLVAADIAALLLSRSGSAVPVGIMTVLLGAPLLAWAIRRLGKGSSGIEPAGTAKRTAGPPAFGLVLAAALLGLLLIAGAALSLGEPVLGPAALLALDGAHALVAEIRLARLGVAFGAGALFALSGLLLQASLRNPLASPKLLGINHSAALGAVTVLVFLPNLALAPQTAAFAGAAACLLLVLWLGHGADHSPMRLALAGLCVAVATQALSGFVILRAHLQVAEALVWLSGSLYGATGDKAVRLLVAGAVALALLVLAARRLDLLGLDDEHGRALGARPGATRIAALAGATAAAAIAVSTVGAVSFVGLIAPHAARLLAGAKHSRLVPLTALLGGSLLATADLVGRLALSPREIPAGLVVARIGAPYMLLLLRRAARAS